MDSVMHLVNLQQDTDRRWVHDALTSLAQEAARSADTHWLKLNSSGLHDIDFYFEDEAAHPSGRLKHRVDLAPLNLMLRNSLEAGRAPVLA